MYAAVNAIIDDYETSIFRKRKYEKQLCTILPTVTDLEFLRRIKSVARPGSKLAARVNEALIEYDLKERNLKIALEKIGQAQSFAVAAEIVRQYPYVAVEESAQEKLAELLKAAIVATQSLEELEEIEGLIESGFEKNVQKYLITVFKLCSHRKARDLIALRLGGLPFSDRVAIIRKALDDTDTGVYLAVAICAAKNKEELDSLVRVFWEDITTKTKSYYYAYVPYLEKKLEFATTAVEVRKIIGQIPADVVDADNLRAKAEVKFQRLIIEDVLRQYGVIPSQST